MRWDETGFDLTNNTTYKVGFMSLSKLRKIEASLERIASVDYKKEHPKVAASVMDKGFGHDEKYSDKTVGEMSKDVFDKMSGEILKFFKKVERAYDTDSKDTQEIKKVFFNTLEERVKLWKRVSKVAAEQSEMDVKHLAKDLLNQAVRELQGSSADFIQIIYHDGEFKLNDVGDIAIPSRSIGSMSINKDPATGKIDKYHALEEIKDFIQEMRVSKVASQSDFRKRGYPHYKKLI